MAELTHALCQQGEPMWKQKAEHPPHITHVRAGGFATGLGRKVKSTKHGYIPTQPPKVATLGPDLTALHNIKKVPLETASECGSRYTRKLFVGGVPKFNFGGGKTQERVQDVYALQGMQYREGNEYLLL